MALGKRGRMQVIMSSSIAKMLHDELGQIARACPLSEPLPTRDDLDGLICLAKRLVNDRKYWANAPEYFPVSSEVADKFEERYKNVATAAQVEEVRTKGYSKDAMFRSVKMLLDAYQKGELPLPKERI